METEILETLPTWPILPTAVEIRFLRAAAEGDAGVVVALLNEVDVNCADIDGRTALHFATRNWKTDIVRLLLAHPGIDVNRRASNGQTPLHKACHYCATDIFHLFLRHPDVDFDARTNLGRTPLWYACYTRGSRMLHSMIALSRGLCFNVRGKTYEDLWQTPLQMAMVYNPDAAELLESYIADPLRVRHATRVELRYADSRAFDLFGLIVLLADDFLRSPPDPDDDDDDDRDRDHGHLACRFLMVARRIPLELQMILCLRAVEQAQDNIKTNDAEGAFRDLAHFFAAK